MRLRVVLTRQRGVARSQRDLARAEGVVGELLVGERQDPVLRRTTRVATLTGFGDAKPSDLLPPLFDATVVWIAPQGLVLSGIERIAVDGGCEVELAQAWWARVP
jgi:hypothetical protein